jgi:hypothetical protein
MVTIMFNKGDIPRQAREMKVVLDSPLPSWLSTKSVIIYRFQSPIVMSFVRQVTRIT